MDKIKITISAPLRTVCDVVKITPEAQLVLKEILNKHNTSARKVVSELIIQGADLLEFVKE